MQNRFQKETAAHGVDIHFLMIDSIGAFYWVDRASKPLALEGDNRRYLSLQSVAEAVVQEIRKILQLQPMLVLATKTNIYGMGAITSDTKRTFRKWTSQDTLDLRTSSRGMEEHLYREYMPLVWQSFVTHRILLRVSGWHLYGCIKHLRRNFNCPSILLHDLWLCTRSPPGIMAIPSIDACLGVRYYILFHKNIYHFSCHAQ
ncbi:DNA repair protein XRCC2 isoform X1 [Cinnamomum micranthum f. kanehirae]|uniref:DNA repair protein XRCC2 isoform X1 n=1 Tax=Cinnamomum micranthum f. kanehirae TaxID=337451 RepID=A0A3S3MZL3_9MAGN|nr:DNA repair protein XRCC2 isoform X1 [Cinnamomum micranthum f. kanehirae]